MDATLGVVLACLFVLGMFVHAIEMARGCPHGPDCIACARSWRDKGDDK